MLTPSIISTDPVFNFHSLCPKLPTIARACHLSLAFFRSSPQLDSANVSLSFLLFLPLVPAKIPGLCISVYIQRIDLYITVVLPSLPSPLSFLFLSHGVPSHQSFPFTCLVSAVYQWLGDDLLFISILPTLASFSPLFYFLSHSILTLGLSGFNVPFSTVQLLTVFFPPLFFLLTVSLGSRSIGNLCSILFFLLRVVILMFLYASISTYYCVNAHSCPDVI